MQISLVCFVIGLCALSSTVSAVNVDSADDLIILFQGAKQFVQETIDLIADINFANSENRLLFPLGASNTSYNCVVFNGTLHGNGHRVKNLVMDTSSSSNQYCNAGLFCGLKDALVEDLVIESSCTFVGANVGALAVSTEGNVTLSNVKTPATISGTNLCGGLFGDSRSLVVEHCVSQVNITGACYNAGGLVGNIYIQGEKVTIHESTSNASISSLNTGAQLGGLIGMASLSSDAVCEIIQCTSECDITGPYVGGFIGVCSSSSVVMVENCTNHGDITSQKNGSFIGGFFGRTSLSKKALLMVKNSLNMGNMQGLHVSVRAGGFFSSLKLDESANVTIENNINHGQVLGNAQSCYPGGFVGDLTVLNGTSLFSNNTNYGLVTGYSLLNTLGGFAGTMTVYSEAVFLSNINNGTVTCLESVSYAGGFVGELTLFQNSFIDFINNTVNGVVSGFNESDEIAGFVGYLYLSGVNTTANFKDCSVHGLISCSAKSCDIGGFLGIIHLGSGSPFTVSMRNTVNNANVLCDGDSCNVGGFIGKTSINDVVTVDLQSCMNNGNVIASNVRSYAGGFVGLFSRINTNRVLNTTFESSTNN